MTDNFNIIDKNDRTKELKMHVPQDYVGSVYGGLGHLLLDYYQLKQLDIPKKLFAIQNLERFDYILWRDLLSQLDQELQRPALGLEIAQLVQAKHLGIIGYLALSSETLGKPLCVIMTIIA